MSGARHRRAGAIGVLVSLTLGCCLAGCGRSQAGSARHSAAASGSGIPRSLLAEARPIGAGARFHPAAGDGSIGACRRSLGRRLAVHVEVFAKNRVVILPAGIGVPRPWTLPAGRLRGAHCYTAIVTLEPTGVVLARRGHGLRLGALFAAWEQPLSQTRVASFRAAPGSKVSVFVNGRRYTGSPRAVPLTNHAEIVIEVGPHVPPHKSFDFAPGS